MTFDPEKFSYDDHASDGEVRLLAPGDYIANVKGFKRTRERGKPQIDLTIGIRASCETGDSVDSVCWETVTLAENAIWRLADLCKAAGSPPTFNLNSDAEIAGAIKGRFFVVGLRVDEWQGKRRNKIDGYRSLSSEDESLIENLGLDAGASGNGGGADPTSSGSRYADDDIPF